MPFDQPNVNGFITPDMCELFTREWYISRCSRPLEGSGFEPDERFTNAMVEGSLVFSCNEDFTARICCGVISGITEHTHDVGRTYSLKNASSYLRSLTFGFEYWSVDNFPLIVMSHPRRRGISAPKLNYIYQSMETGECFYYVFKLYKNLLTGRTTTLRGIPRVILRNMPRVIEPEVSVGGIDLPQPNPDEVF